MILKTSCLQLISLLKSTLNERGSLNPGRKISKLVPSFRCLSCSSNSAVNQRHKSREKHESLNRPLKIERLFLIVAAECVVLFQKYAIKIVVTGYIAFSSVPSALDG